MRCSVLLLNSMASWSRLSKAWTSDFLTSEASGCTRNTIARALERTLPLLQDPTSVAFVCRYRADVIQPLTNKQIHQLSDHVQKYNSLNSLREKVLKSLRQCQEKRKKGNHSELILRVQTSISKSELEDVYAPFKPPSKGSLEDRIRNDYPDLIAAVDELWTMGKTDLSLHPRDAAVTILANRIASHLPVMDSVLDYGSRQCRVCVKQAPRARANSKSKSRSKSKSNAKTKGKEPDESKIDKYRVYYDFENKLSYVKDHQVLAIRRGIDQKVLKQSFDIDNHRTETIIAKSIPSMHRKRNHLLYRDAIHDAWTRLIRKRVTSRLWKQKCGVAEERAIEVFCDNLRKALLAPPATTAQAILVLDPGFQAGIKCAILDLMGQVESLQTVNFLGSSIEQGKEKLTNLLQLTKSMTDGENVSVVLGNGHGFREARNLVSQVAADSRIQITVNMVSEAGASVWSVTETAKKEFPDQSAAALAAISIGRRYQNPLNELVKIPPKSLGLGMYQHDLNEKDLERKLTLSSINAVAEVGVDINSCSTDILEKVPSLTKSLCEEIVKARPLRSRSELLSIPGIGPKTFETCAAFVRIHDGLEPLDATLVHPESYEIARWLLKSLKLELGNPKSAEAATSKLSVVNLNKHLAKKAAERFNCTEERVLTVAEHLIFSITRPDPRISEVAGSNPGNTFGSPCGCSAIPPSLSRLDALKKACPVRHITATIRNVVDFGAFVDFGGENDGLLHRTKLGPIQLQSLLVGQEIGIDILSVSEFEKVSVALTGLNLSDTSKRNAASESTNSAPSKKPRR